MLFLRINCCFSFVVDLVPLNDHKIHYVAIRWTSDGGIFELIIDGILQSTKVGIEVGGKISGQSRFMIGSSVSDKRSLDGYINNLNVWDEVSAVDFFTIVHFNQLS